jgi:acyl-CoA synthetase (AMP-forming)/AMP-acid ligase II
LEVEKFLETECPYIRTAVVVGVPDPKWQEAVTAVVSLKPEHEQEGKLSSQDIITWCKGRIAGYKAPKNVIILGHKEMEQYFLLLGKRDKSKIKPLALERLGIEEK